MLSTALARRKSIFSEAPPAKRKEFDELKRQIESQAEIDGPDDEIAGLRALVFCKAVDIKQNPRASRKRPPLDQGTIVCNVCREKYLVFWNPADPTDVDEARKMFTSASWTCDRCALRILRQRMRHPQRNLDLTDKKPGQGREPRVMILVDPTKRFRVKAT